MLVYLGFQVMSLNPSPVFFHLFSTVDMEIVYPGLRCLLTVSICAHNPDGEADLLRGKTEMHTPLPTHS